MRVVTAPMPPTGRIPGVSISLAVPMAKPDDPVARLPQGQPQTDLAGILDRRQTRGA